MSRRHWSPKSREDGSESTPGRRAAIVVEVAGLFTNASSALVCIKSERRAGGLGSRRPPGRSHRQPVRLVKASAADLGFSDWMRSISGVEWPASAADT